LLKAAVKSGQPPIAVIFNDPTHKEWNEWDFKLFKAYYILQDWYRDGIPIWWDESDRVVFEVKARTSKSRAAIERAQESSTANNKKPIPGRYFIAEPKTIDGGDFPTRDEWLEELARQSGNSAPVTKFGSGPGPKHNIVQGRK
jgi:hypothetical protein